MFQGEGVMIGKGRGWWKIDLARIPQTPYTWKAKGTVAAGVVTHRWRIWPHFSSSGEISLLPLLQLLPPTIHMSTEATWGVLWGYQFLPRAGSWKGGSWAVRRDQALILVARTGWRDGTWSTQGRLAISAGSQGSEECRLQRSEAYQVRVSLTALTSHGPADLWWVAD